MTLPKPIIIKAHPTSKQSIADRDKFLCLIGESITVWSFIDRALFILFDKALVATTQKAAIIYYKSPTLRGRVSLLDALLKHVLKNRSLEAWKKINRRIEDLAAIRNVIAHEPPKRLGTSRKGRAVYIYSLHVEPAKRLAGRPANVMYAKDLRSHIRQAEKLERSISQFVGVLIPRRKSGN